MKILVLTGALYPTPGNNANLISKLLTYLKRDNSVHLASFISKEHASSLPEMLNGCSVHWIADDRTDPVRKFVYPAISKVIDRNGYSDAIGSFVALGRLKEIRKEFHYDVVITTMEPFTAGCASYLLPGDVKKVLYLMDPPYCTCNPASDTAFRKRMFRKILEDQDFILTTPFIRKALEKCGISINDDRIAEVGFPMIEKHTVHHMTDDVTMDHGKINLLFCGWLYSDIRSPKYFLDIASSLDERFCIYFMGKECDNLRERFDFNTKAQVITLPQQPYQVALNAMADADVLINIGNSVPVHMPSKTLEYINTGKPIVNFHKLPDCPTLHYTGRYPLCLNLWEGEPLTEETTEAFVRFCVENKGQCVDTSSLAAQFPDCTPEYISNLILEKFGENHE